MNVDRPARSSARLGSTARPARRVRIVEGRPLRIGLVCPYSMSIPGGVQAQVLGLARVLRAMGHEALVLAPCDGPPPATYVMPLGNSIPTAANGSVAPIAPDPPATLRTIRALRDEDFDVLHLHEPLAPGPTMTAVLFHPAPIVGTFHAAGDSSSYRLLNGVVRWLADRIEVRCVVSADAEELADRYLGGDYTTMFNAVELDTYRAAQPLKSAGPTIFFCGRHEERKGLEVLLRALAELPDDVTCWVASDGPETERLQHDFADDRRIEWLGRITDAEKVARLKGATVFCAPSLRSESFGVVLLEAMAADTPIVATELPGYLRVARPGVDGLMVAPGDAGALADALRSVLADDELAARLRRSGSARAEEFSMEALADRYVKIYQDLATGDYDRSAPPPARGPMMRAMASARRGVRRARRIAHGGTAT
jgi:phosphatidylinositol alpha-mannosyltransferase